MKKINLAFRQRYGPFFFTKNSIKTKWSYLIFKIANIKIQSRKQSCLTFVVFVFCAEILPLSCKCSKMTIFGQKQPYLSSTIANKDFKNKVHLFSIYMAYKLRYGHFWPKMVIFEYLQESGNISAQNAKTTKVRQLCLLQL